MTKQASLDFFVKKRHTYSEYGNSSKRNGNNGSHLEGVKTKRVHTSFTRKYDPSYIEFGFIAIIDGEVLKPQCIICGDVLARQIPNTGMAESKVYTNANLIHIA